MNVTYNLYTPSWYKNRLHHGIYTFLSLTSLAFFFQPLIVSSKTATRLNILGTSLLWMLSLLSAVLPSSAASTKPSLNLHPNSTSSEQPPHWKDRLLLLLCIELSQLQPGMDPAAQDLWDLVFQNHYWNKLDYMSNHKRRHSSPKYLLFCGQNRIKWSPWLIGLRSKNFFGV